jgi:hypothetical protein
MDGWMTMDGWMVEWMDGCQWMVGWMNDNSVHSKISNRVIYFHINCFVFVCVFGYHPEFLELLLIGPPSLGISPSVVTSCSSSFLMHTSSTLQDIGCEFCPLRRLFT